MSELFRVHQQPEWALAKPIAVNPLPFSPNCTPPRNFLQPYQNPPNAGCPADYIPSMFAHPEGSTGPCQFQRPTPCSQPAPCNIQPVPKNNALQCCAKPNPNYGSAVYRQESISIPDKQQLSESDKPSVPDYKQNIMNMSQSELMIVQMSNRLRMMEWMIVALLILTIVLLILHLRK